MQETCAPDRGCSVEKMNNILIPLLTGIFALAGVALASFSSWFLSHLQARKERHRLSREKLEELSLHIVESLSWLEGATGARTFAELSSFSLCPSAQKATTLAWLYFPELRKPTSDYSNDIVHMHKFLVSVFEPLRDSSAGADAARNPHFEHNVEELRKSRQLVLDKILEIAPEYTKA